MKYFINVLIIILFFGCNTKKYIVMPNVQGKIYSKIDNKPVENIYFFVSKYAINKLIDTVRTDANGRFFYDGVFVKKYSDLRLYSTSVQQVFVLKKNKEYRYLDVKKSYNKDDYNKTDTIDLGIIYFEDLKSIDKDSIPE